MLYSKNRNIIYYLSKWFSIILFSIFFLQIYIRDGAAQSAMMFDKVIPPSPAASALGKFGNTEVSLATGVPKVSIPIYNGGTDQLKLDVSLDYNAGGIKVDEIATNVGLGWSISTGGVISRIINGMPDDMTNGFWRNSFGIPDGIGTVNQVAGCLQWDNIGAAARPNNVMNCGAPLGCLDYNTFFKYVNIQQGLYDGQYDIFHYSFDGYSGKFIIGTDGTILQIPRTNLRIEIKLSGGPSSPIEGFIVTTPTGAKYIFNEPEYTNLGIQSCSTEPESCDVSESTDCSSWYLKKVISPTRTDSIQFNYQGKRVVYESYMGETEYYRALGSSSFDRIRGYHGSFPGDGRPNLKRITSIQLPGKVSINFQYDDVSRLDVTMGDNALRKILISEGNNQYGYKLNYAYFTPTKKIPYNSIRTLPDYHYRLVLESVNKFSGTANEPPYSFKYLTAGFPDRFSTSQDHWGYYNAARNNSLLPEVAGFPGANRTPSEAASAGVLGKITYPAGGTTEFEFEGNKSSGIAVGGIRIKKIVDYDGMSHTNDITTIYSYTGGNFTSPIYGNTTTKSGITYNTRTSLSIRTLSYYQRSPITYAGVEVSKLKDGKPVGKTVYNFRNEGRLLFGSHDEHISKDYPFTAVPFLEWADGLLSNEKYFNNENNLIKEVRYEYDVKIEKIQLPKFKSLKVNLVAGPYFKGRIHSTEVTNSDCALVLIQYPDGHIEVEKDYAIYKGVNYYPYTGSAAKTKIVETEYSGTQVSTREINNIYDAANQIKQSSFVNSQGDLVSTFYYYPYDYTIPGAITELKNLNMISLPVSSETWLKDQSNNEFMINAEVTDYKIVNATMPLACAFYTLKSAPVPRSSIGQFDPNKLIRNSDYFVLSSTINEYDEHGNLIQYTKNDGIPVSFQWGYNKLFAVAKVENAVSNSIFYEGFEAESPNRILNDSKMGIGSFSGSYSLQLKNLPTGSYKLSYWKKTNGIWQLEEIKDINITGSTYTATLSGQVDEIRFHPANAFMTTYNYSMLAGLTATADANSSVTYCEYDVFYRLRNIRDQNRNIIKNYTYHYSNTFFFSAAKSAVFTKQCSFGFSGNQVTYTVPESAYTSTISQADADAKAQNDINTNGQTFANLSGTCTEAPSVNVNIHNLGGVTGARITFSGATTGGLSGSLTFDVPSNNISVIVPMGTYAIILESPSINYLQVDSGTPVQGVNVKIENVAINKITEVYVNSRAYGNLRKDENFKRNNCASGMQGSTITYSVPADKYFSAISLSNANLKAQAEIVAHGQNFANANGSCYFSSQVKSGVFTKECPFGSTGNAVTYVVAAGAHTSTISQADADAKAQNDVNSNGQAFANTNGTCTAAPSVQVNIHNLGGVTGARITFSGATAGGLTGSLPFDVPANVSSVTVPIGTYSIILQSSSNTALQIGTGSPVEGINVKVDNVNVNTSMDIYINSRIFGNTTRSQNFTRNNCTGGSIGSNVTYTVAANTYSSAIALDNANAKAQADITANGQSFANANGSCYFNSQVKSGVFTKQCPFGSTGNSVTYVVAAGTHTSTISQTDADAKAQNDVNSNGQAFANTNGTCTAAPSVQVNIHNLGGVTGARITFSGATAGGLTGSLPFDVPANVSSVTVPIGTYSITLQSSSSTALQIGSGSPVEGINVKVDNVNVNTSMDIYINSRIFGNTTRSQNFTRNNCAGGSIGSTVTYTVAANTYSSAIALDNANAKAQADITVNGQNFANANGSCHFSSQTKSGVFTKQCSFGLKGNQLTYTVAAGSYTSAISQADADTKAQNDVNANGQGFANANGTCTPEPVINVTVMNFTPTRYQIIFGGTTTGGVSGSVSHSFPPGSTTVSIPQGTYSLMFTTQSGMTTYTFRVGSLSPVTGVNVRVDNVSMTGNTTNNNITIDF